MNFILVRKEEGIQGKGVRVSSDSSCPHSFRDEGKMSARNQTKRHAGSFRGDLVLKQDQEKENQLRPKLKAQHEVSFCQRRLREKGLDFLFVSVVSFHRVCLMSL